MQIDLKKVNLIKTRKSGESVHILKDMDFAIHSNEILCVVGPSGSGKSTLLRTLNRLEEITSGVIWYDGTSIFKIPPRSLRKQVGMVLQTPSLFDTSVYDNLIYGLKLHGASEMEQKQKAEEMIGLVGLEKDFFERDAHSLSVGQQQRVSIARTLINQPDTLLLDEITSALDPHSTNIIEHLLFQLRHETRKTIVMVTHSMELAERIADRVALVMNGEIIEVKEKQEFFRSPEKTQTKEFLKLFTGASV